MMIVEFLKKLIGFGFVIGTILVVTYLLAPFL